MNHMSLLLCFLQFIWSCRPLSSESGEINALSASKPSELTNSKGFSEALTLAVEPKFFTDPDMAELQLITLKEVGKSCAGNKNPEIEDACRSVEKLTTIRSTMLASGCGPLPMEEGVVADLVISGAMHWNKEVSVKPFQADVTSERDMRGLSLQAIRLALYHTLLERWSIAADRGQIYEKCMADLPTWTQLSPEFQEPVELACQQFRDNKTQILGAISSSDYSRINTLISILNNHIYSINGRSLTPAATINPPAEVQKELDAYASAWAELQSIPAMSRLYTQRAIFEKVGSRQILADVFHSGKKTGMLIEHGSVLVSDFERARAALNDASADHLKYLQTVTPYLQKSLERITARTPLARSQHIFGVISTRFPVAVGWLLAEMPSNAAAFCAAMKVTEIRREGDEAGWRYLGILASIAGALPTVELLSVASLSFISARQAGKQILIKSLVADVANAQALMSARTLVNVAIYDISASIPVFAKNWIKYKQAEETYGLLRMLVNASNESKSNQANAAAISAARSTMWMALMSAIFTGVCSVPDAKDLLRVLTAKLNGNALIPQGLGSEMEILLRSLREKMATNAAALPL
jgi:hypothetical protein